MSCSTWHNYGYGICTGDITEQDMTRLQALLELAPEFQAKIQAWFAETGIEDPTWDDYMDFSEKLGIATILKEVIFEAEGIELTACDDFEGAGSLLSHPRYPWETTDPDRQMTKDHIQQIFRRYAGILTDTTVEIDYQSVENGG